MSRRDYFARILDEAVDAGMLVRNHSSVSW